MGQLDLGPGQWRNGEHLGPPAKSGLKFTKGRHLRQSGFGRLRTLPPAMRGVHGTEGNGNILQSPALVISAFKIFGRTNFTSTYSVCTSEGIRTQAFQSGVRCSSH
ncbi:hypothetical protein TNCV_2333341 [Trichonephila clavipes]|nr:hypothetical protein TNCV_2333341 [Trichonephila clavipes]